MKYKTLTRKIILKSGNILFLKFVGTVELLVIKYMRAERTTQNIEQFDLLLVSLHQLCWNMSLAIKALP